MPTRTIARLGKTAKTAGQQPQDDAAAGDGGYPVPTFVVDDKVDYLEVDGHEPIAGISADWSDRHLDRKGDGPLCQPAPLHFDSANSSGRSAWGQKARGAVVVALRGEVEFEVMARRAEASGASGLVIVDNEDEWEDDWEMTQDDARRPPPAVPAVLVPKKCGELLCSGREGLKASISRRYTGSLNEEETRSLTFLRMRGVEARLRFEH